MTSTSEIAVKIEKPSLNTKSPPNAVWQLSACLKVMTVGFVAMSVVATVSLVMSVQLRSDVDALRSELARMDSLESHLSELNRSVAMPDEAPAAQSVVLSTVALAPAGFSSISLFDGEWAPGVQMPSERSDHQSVLCGGKIVLLGGLNGSAEAVATTWAFDPVLETFDTGKAPMPTARYRFGAACLDGKVYVAGGYPTKAAGDAGQCLSSVDMYDVGADTWTAAAPLSLPRGDLALSVASGRLFAMGGYGYEYPYPDPANAANEAFDPQSNSWAAMAPMPGGGKGDIAAVEVGGVVYVPGGWNGVFKDELVAYNVTADTWAVRASMHRARGDKALATLEGACVRAARARWFRSPVYGAAARPDAPLVASRARYHQVRPGMHPPAVRVPRNPRSRVRHRR